LIDGIDRLDGLDFLTSLHSSVFHSLILAIISMDLFGFEKLAALIPVLTAVGRAGTYELYVKR